MACLGACALSQCRAQSTSSPGWAAPVRALTTTVQSVARWVTCLLLAELTRWVSLQEERPVDADEEWIVVEAPAPDERPFSLATRPAVAWQCMGIAGCLWSCLYTTSVLFTVELV